MTETSMTGAVNLTTPVMTSNRTVPRARPFPPRLVQILDEIKGQCVERHRTTPPKYEGEPHCNRTMDFYGGCWDDTQAGTIGVARCPDIPSFNPNAFIYRECTANGTWYVNATTGKRWANYTECFTRQQIADDVKDIYIFVAGFSLSLVMLIISLVIFFKFRQLRCDRITIHKNLFLSYVFTGFTWLLYYLLAALDGHVMLENPVWCQVLHVLCQYFVVCNFMWMFCEGLYLNTIMVYAFSSGKILIISCYCIGWGFPVVLSGIYAGVRSTSATESRDCWLNESSLQWIMYGPIVLSIVVNIIFLVNIVRLLVTKLRQMPEASQTRKATRATLILVPLLGLQYLLLPIRPEPDTTLDDVYHVFVALLISLQGAFVSIIYCFCNGEVLAVMRRKWNQHQLMKGNSMRSTSHGATTTYTTMDPVTQANAASFYSSMNNKEPAMEMSKVEADGS